MKDEDLKLKDRLDAEEDLLDFDLEDFSLDDVDASDEEIIELVDLVERGPGLEETGYKDLAGLLDEDASLLDEEVDISMDETADMEQAFLEASAEESETEPDISEMSLSDLALEDELEQQGVVSEGATDAEAEEELDMSEISLSDLGVEGEQRAEEEPKEREIGEEDLERILTEPGDEAAFELGEDESFGLEEEGEEKEIGEEDLESFFHEEAEGETDLETVDLGVPESDEMKAEEDISVIIQEEKSLEGEEPAEEILQASGPEATATISEEKIEAIVTAVVQNVVERVTRETMNGMAERIMAGAIDVLKESIEPMIAGVVQEVAERSARETMTNVAEKVITEAIDALRGSLETRPE